MDSGDTRPPGRWRRIAVRAAAALAVWALLGFAVLPAVLRPVVAKRLAGSLHRPVTLRGLALNPFTFSATLEGLDVKEKGGAGPFLSFERLYANLEAVSLLSGGPVVREIRLTKPSVSLVRNADGTYNVQDLLDEAMKPAPKDARPLRFSLNNITIEDGSLDFDDRPKKTAHHVRGLKIGIPFVSNLPSKVEISTLPEFAATVNGAPFALHGKTKPFSETKETSLDVDLEDVDLPFYLAYAPESALRLTSARLDTKLTIAFTQPTKGTPALTVSGTAALRRVAVAIGKEPLAAWERLDIALASADVFARKARLARVSVAKPEVWVRRDGTGALQLASLAPPAQSAAPAAAKAETPFLLEVGELGIAGGTLRWDDAGAPLRAVLSDVAVTLKDLSTAPGKAAALTASARGDGGETLKAGGTVSLEPASLDGELAVSGVRLARFAPYYDRLVTFAVDDGTLELKTRLKYVAGPKGAASVSGLEARLASPRLRKKREKTPFFTASSITVARTSLDMAAREAVVGELASDGGFLAVVREKDGTADILKLMTEPAAGTPPPAPAPPWKVVVKRLSVGGYRIAMDDRGWRRPARYAITRLDVLLTDLSTEKGAKGTLATRFGIDGKGVATATGPVGFAPMFADLKVGVKAIDLVPLEPYLVQNMNLSLAKGTVSASGNLGFREDEGGKAVVTYTGSALVADLFTVDPDTQQEFVRWASFSASGMRAGYNPMFMEVEKLALSGVRCDLAIGEDGTVNVRKVLGTPAPPEEDEAEETAGEVVPPPSAPAPPPPDSVSASKEPSPVETMPIRIDALTVEGGRIGLSDHLIKPSYSATLENVGGRITGLSSKAGTVADLDLRGNLASHSPLSITGKVNPLAAATFADVKIAFKDIDLSPFTPYSGKYAGYAIAHGTLTMEASYKLENRRLSAKNRFLVDRFELGDKVESKDATKLPVRLAVSLLKDKDGLIDLDLPIEGSLDDPKFRLGRVIWKVVTNLIGKAVTAPFALLGKLFGGGGGEELSSVDFAPGREALDETATKRLDGLAKALGARPGLTLEATGRFSGAEDAEGLRRFRFERKVKTQKLADLAKTGAAPANVDDVVVAPEERVAYLTKAYKKEKFPKPTNALGFARSLPPEEMEKLMLANLAVPDEDLRGLAMARANAVKAYLIAQGKVDAARVLVVEPGEKPADAREKARASRVDFSLR